MNYKTSHEIRMFVVWIEIECLSVERGGEGIIEQIYRNIYIYVCILFHAPHLLSSRFNNNSGTSRDELTLYRNWAIGRPTNTQYLNEFLVELNNF